MYGYCLIGRAKSEKWILSQAYKYYLTNNIYYARLQNINKDKNDKGFDVTEKDKTLYYRGLVAANIKRLRQARHMGQKELAEESHVGIATISNLERALYNPDLSVLLSIAEVLGVSYLDLFADNEEFFRDRVEKKAYSKDRVRNDMGDFIMASSNQYSPEKLKFLYEQVKLISQTELEIKSTN